MLVGMLLTTAWLTRHWETVGIALSCLLILAVYAVQHRQLRTISRPVRWAAFGLIRNFTNQLSNVFLVGRNGMHCYNNQDYSMLTARFAAQAILSGNPDKSAIWNMNVDDDYHEEKQSAAPVQPDSRHEVAAVPEYSTSSRR